MSDRFHSRTEKSMASRDKNQSAPHHHQPLLSSLVIRPSNSDGGAGAGVGGGSGGRAGDYEPGEVHRDPPPPYSRSDRYADDPGLSLFRYLLFDI